MSAVSEVKNSDAFQTRIDENYRDLDKFLQKLNKPERPQRGLIMPETERFKKLAIKIMWLAKTQKDVPLDIRKVSNFTLKVEDFVQQKIDFSLRDIGKKMNVAITIDIPIEVPKEGFDENAIKNIKACALHCLTQARSAYRAPDRAHFQYWFGVGADTPYPSERQESSLRQLSDNFMSGFEQ